MSYIGFEIMQSVDYSEVIRCSLAEKKVRRVIISNNLILLFKNYVK